MLCQTAESAVVSLTVASASSSFLLSFMKKGGGLSNPSLQRNGRLGGRVTFLTTTASLNVRLCQYGLGPCWGGAYEALKGISDIDVVRPIPSNDDSVAFVYLKDDVLPDIDVWRSEFQKTANGSYHMRGIELTLSGRVAEHDNNLVMEKTSSRPELSLGPLQASSKIEFHAKSGAQKAQSDEEAGAYGRLAAVVAKHADGENLQVTGRLHKQGPNKFSLDVRGFEVADGV